MPKKEVGDYVAEEMHDLKKGSKTVKSKKQAVAIGLSRARKAGKDVPPPPAKKKAAKKKRSKST